jgi:hypothetical protein
MLVTVPSHDLEAMLSAVAAMKVGIHVSKDLILGEYHADVFLVGHFAKDCPNQTERAPRTCRNCG